MKRSVVGPIGTKPAKTLKQICEIDGSYLYLQQFLHTYICGSSHLPETEILKVDMKNLWNHIKENWVYSWWILAIWNHSFGVYPCACPVLLTMYHFEDLPFWKEMQIFWHSWVPTCLSCSQSPTIKVLCLTFFINRIWYLGWFMPVGHFRDHTFIVFI